LISESYLARLDGERDSQANTLVKRTTFSLFPSLPTKAAGWETERRRGGGMIAVRVFWPFNLVHHHPGELDVV
jgi:hypothetical protein